MCDCGFYWLVFCVYFQVTKSFAICVVPRNDKLSTEIQFEQFNLAQHHINSLNA